MRIPFAAYAADCTVSAELSLEADRLADLLAASADIGVEGARLEALEDGHVVEAGFATLLLDDLCLVAATGPRGRPDRRVWTRQLPARAQVGPYAVYGYIHAAPTVDPFRTYERKEIVALTSAVIEYERDGQQVRDEVEVALLNRRKIDLLEPVTAAEMGTPGVPGPAVAVDALALGSALDG